ncbi:MAG: hypothetical protein SH859_13990 [Hyphomicrobium aestuarii]|mgnify:CR=1 FL=1|nr:hypothetical protein [Hyphomicrobium aestuarii]
MTMMNFDLGLLGFAVAVFAGATVFYAGVSSLFHGARKQLSSSTGTTTLPDPARHLATDQRPGAAAGSTATSQLDRLASLIGDQFDRADATQRLHNRAGQQLDLASYAIQTLVQDLRGIVPALTPAPPAVSPTPADIRPRATGLSLAA